MLHNVSISTAPHNNNFILFEFLLLQVPMENLEEGVGVVTSNVSNKDCFAASVVGVVMFLSLSLCKIPYCCHCVFLSAKIPYCCRFVQATWRHTWRHQWVSGAGCWHSCLTYSLRPMWKPQAPYRDQGPELMCEIIPTSLSSMYVFP